MRRREPVRIGDALQDFFTRNPHVARKLAEARIPDLWPSVAGAAVAAHTTAVKLEPGGRLFIYISSSVARNEVFMAREHLKNAINAASGINLVSSIIVK